MHHDLVHGSGMQRRIPLMVARALRSWSIQDTPLLPIASADTPDGDETVAVSAKEQEDNMSKDAATPTHDDTHAGLEASTSSDATEVHSGHDVAADSLTRITLHLQVSKLDVIEDANEDNVLFSVAELFNGLPVHMRARTGR